MRRASVDWHVDETYTRVGGKWHYLWRAVDANGQMVGFRLTAWQDAKAAKGFLNKASERGCACTGPVQSVPTRHKPALV
ncbi:DDE-type integrase/transposase/recombinase [Boseongicola sp. H5]|uniref:DDE-type integrase/transposase/recombinase n=1 Tax=Boseongicola sp. H5 TaxID=2763261 RepID=UPI001D0A395C|nr:DDE-type integrase/transposase/recombinase [Boseongicola sp. H5]